jgi:GT2 family glycosyltransferase
MSLHFKKLLSFVIPTTNDPRVLETIASIISSNGWSPKDCEIIVVVNNCPKHFYENLLREVNSYNLRNNIKILYLKNGNIAKARNMGIKTANGQYIIHIDSDCKIAPEYIKKLKEYLFNENFLIGRGAVRFVPVNNPFSKANCELKELVYFSRKEIAYTPNLIVRKDIYDKVGLFDEKLFHGEDTEWSQRLKNFGIFPKFLNDLIVEHVDHKSIFKIITTYFHYGIGRAYRFKKILSDDKLSFNEKCKVYYRLFNEIPNLSSINSFISKAIILFLYLVRNIGVCYGVVKWSVLK